MSNHQNEIEMNHAETTPKPTGPFRPAFQWRALTSVVITLSFLVLAVSGLVLWMAPPGRIANWTNWALLGLHKQEWAGLHLWFSLVFVVASVVHLVFNWRPLLGYFKNKLSHQFGWRREWLAAGVLCAAVFFGTRAGLPPFSSLLVFTDNFRESWEQQSTRPPIPHAELFTLRELAEKAGVALTNALSRLEARGIKEISPDLRVAELAKRNRLPAQQIYEIMTATAVRDGQRPGQGKGRGGGFGGGGGGGGGGAGRKTLAQFCQDEGIDLATAQTRLAAKNIKAASDLTLRDIAVNHGYQRPYEILEIIRGESPPGSSP